MKLKIFVILSIVALYSCQDQVYEAIDADSKITLLKPSNFPDIQFNDTENPITKNGVELGRKLFYEGDLSSDGAVPCAFCHIQENAFTHHGHSISHGVDGEAGMRNTPPVQNMAFMKNIMWEGVLHNLSTMSLAPISNPVEMNGNFSVIIPKLENNKNYNYKTAFKKAFGSEEITSTKILSALGQFMTTMVSANSRYDKFVRNEGGVLSSTELDGRQLFQQKCSSCHATDLFTDQSFRNNGTVYSDYFQDNGRMRVTLDSLDFMKFRVPSLRNIELTAPYMHDGRLYTLEAVLNFYSSGVHNYPNLDPLLKQNGVVGIPMTTDEKQKIIAFLKTLTDNEFVTNKKYAEFP